KDVASEVAQSFAERQVHPHHVPANTQEDEVFERLSRLEFQTMARGAGGILFRTTLLKAYLSSPAACRETIRHRLRRLEKMTGPEAEHDREQLTSLDALIAQVTPDRFGKLARLFALIEGWPGERVVIFSERIETLRFLDQQLRDHFGLDQHQMGVFYGTLDDQRQQAMVKDFGTANGKVRLLLGSDAASEGINLHYYCHRLVHFDIPWSLITLEQRNGRIDRFGQTETPDIHYLLTVPRDVELRGDLRVLDRLIEKENAAHKNLGDVAWLMRLHEAELEEQRVAQGIENHEPAESVVPDEPEEFDFLALLSGEGDKEEIETVDPVSLYADDLAYCREAFEELDCQPEWHEHLSGFSFHAPEDLRVRYDYLPPELRQADWELKLTTDREL
ncbi:MAG: ATP-dependent helicase, partial [Candidatus Eremiobacteraeota bacterium]|nr:ATP-dependent helicase [Candidatus Eremiobacteraeota bacterium]